MDLGSDACDRPECVSMRERCKILSHLIAEAVNHSDNPKWMKAFHDLMEGLGKTKHVCDNSCQDTGHLVLERKEAKP